MVASRQLISDVFQWDVVNWSRALPLWHQHLPSGPGLVGLTIGERQGGLSLWLAVRGIRVHCTDVVPFPPVTFALHRRYQVGHMVHYALADATALPYRAGAFDVVMFKSVLGDLRTKPRQRLAVSEIHRVLRPGGRLIFAENLTATRVHQALRRRFVRWTSDWRYLDLEADLDLFGDFARLEWEAHGVLGAFGRSERQRRWLGHADSLVGRALPPRSRYLLAGACHKGV